MSVLPAFCDNCGAIFNSGIIGGDGIALNTTFIGCSAGPCPKCGGMGHIPDGVYNFIGNTIEFLSGPQRTLEELKRFSEILKAAQEKQATPDKLSEEIGNELPQYLYLLKDILPKSKKEFYSFIGLILTTITILINSANFVYSKQKSNTEVPKNTKTEVQQLTQIVINNSIVQIGNGQNIQIKNSTIKKKKIGPNEKCPCGSGLKYKKCCGG
jgi:hypothetical protein